MPDLKQFMESSVESLRFLVSKKKASREDNKEKDQQKSPSTAATTATLIPSDEDDEDDTAGGGGGDENELSALLSSSNEIRMSEGAATTTTRTRKKPVPKKPILAPFERVTEAQTVTLRNTSELQQLRWHVVSNASSQFTVKQGGNKELLEPGEETEIIVSVRKHAKQLQRHTKLLIQYGSEGILIDSKTDKMKDIVSKEQQLLEGNSQPQASASNKLQGGGGEKEKNFGALKGQSWKGRNFDMLHSQTLVIDVFVDVDIPRLMTLVKTVEDTNTRLQSLHQGILAEKSKQREMRRYREGITETHEGIVKELAVAKEHLADFEARGFKEYKVHVLHFFVFALMLSSTWLLGFHLPHVQVVPGVKTSRSKYETR